MYDMSIEWMHGSTLMVIAALKLVNAYHTFLVMQEPKSDHMFRRKFIIMPNMHYMKLFPYMEGSIETNLVSPSDCF